MPKIAIFFEN